jgi:peroxiredoxin
VNPTDVDLVALADCVLHDAAGAEVRLGDNWYPRAAGPCLVVFVRHFGCIGCSLQVVELAPRLAELDDLGVRVVLVGNSPIERIGDFVARFGLADRGLIIASDPDLRSYAAASMVRSVWGTWGPPGWLGYARGFAAGHTNPGVWGDTNQHGGALLIGADGLVRWSCRVRRVGEVVSGNDVVGAALREAARRVGGWS